MNILYLDEKFVFCEKPIGVLSEAGDGQRVNMPALLRTALAERGEEETVYTVHRLDQFVGGLMVYARSSAAAASLSELIREGRLIKEYFAVVHGVPGETAGEYSDLLFHDLHKNKTFVVKRQRKGVREARLRYQLLQTVETSQGVFSLVRIRLYTGRTHQIRVQFASRGMPLYGDARYGSGIRGAQMALFSCRLSFSYSGVPFEYRLSPPDILPWSLFPVDFGSVAVETF